MDQETSLARALAEILSAAQLLPSQQNIFVEGDVSNSPLISGNQNQVTFNTVEAALPKPQRTGEVSNVPGGGSQTFVGRDDTLGVLHERLSVGGAVAQVAYCWTYWPGEEPVLVVFDDVTDYERVAEVLPPEESRRFVVLMTTRRRQLAVTVEPFEIEVLSEESALALLQQIVGVERTAAELGTAKAICDWVGYLPLGLELVGEYLRQKPEVTYGKLQGRLAAQRTAGQALQKAYPGMTGKLGVMEAFELSWKALSEEAQDVACWLSLFALAPIPWEVAESAVEEAEQEDFEDGRDALIYRSLLRRLEVGRYQLHQLVREYFLAKLAQREDADARRRAYCQVMVALAKQVPSSPTRELLLRLTPVMPHIAEVTTSWQAWLSDEDGELMWPFIAMASFYAGQVAYTKAEPWCANCLETTQNRFGEDHPDVATSLNNLTYLYSSQGRYEDAEPRSAS
ncbi:MAG: tetratricopeptide repeat protein [Phormidesmis sp.]